MYKLLLTLLFVLLAIPDGHAEARRPTDGGEVIEQIPEYRRIRALQRLQGLLRDQPDNPMLATAVVQAQLALARRTGDPRYLGHAQAALAPWWSASAPPPGIAMLRATVRQRRHEFGEALGDLAYVLAHDGGNADALFMRAMIYQVTGDYRSAEQDCRALAVLMPGAAEKACLASVRGFSGDGRASYVTLERLLEGPDVTDPALRTWVLTTLADLAQRLGRHAVAERHFKSALALDAGDPYLVGAYADFLLARARPHEALALLKDAGSSDATLLRRALAARALGQDTAALTAQLRARFASYTLRKDTSHTREQARFELYLAGQAEQALRLALANWQRQREPADAALVLDAALFSGRRAAAQPALAWLRTTRLEDATLATRAAALGAQR